MDDEKKDEGTAKSSENDVVKEVRFKSFKQIGREHDEKVRELKDKENEPEKPPEEEKKDEEVAPAPAKESKSEEKKVEETKAPEPPKEEPKVDVDAVVKKATDEAVAKAKDEFKSEIAGILDKDKTDLEKQKEADELIAAWDKEGRLPKDYQELISETQRIAEAKYNQVAKVREEAAKKAEEEKRIAEEQAKIEEGRKAKEDEQRQYEEFNKQIVSDLNEIYDAKLMPRPADINAINDPNTTDPAAKETQKVLQFGVDLNTKLKSEGKPPVTSLSKIYFLHYKPFADAQKTESKDEVAGADAPVAGNKTTTVAAPTDAMTPETLQRLRNETWGQTLSRIKREAMKKAFNK